MTIARWCREGEKMSRSHSVISPQVCPTYRDQNTITLPPPMALPKQNKSRNFHPQPWNAWPWKSSRGKFCVWPRSKSWAHLLPILQTITFAVGNVGGGGGKQRKLKIYKDQSWPYLSHLFSSFRTFTIVALTSSRTESSPSSSFAFWGSSLPIPTCGPCKVLLLVCHLNTICSASFVPVTRDVFCKDSISAVIFSPASFHI